MAETAIVTREEAEVPSISESTAIIQVIERAALNPNVDIDKMERLLQMQERIMEREAIRSFNEAMRAAQAAMPQVVADADNDQTRSRYARYETVSAAVQPIITEHGFSLSFGEEDSPKPNHLRIVCDVAHVGGYTKRYHGDVPFDMAGIKGNVNKTPTHAYGSTKSYGRRYLKLDIFDIAIKGIDDDGNAAGGGAVISSEQLMALRDLIEQTGTDIAKFCEWAHIEALPDLLERHYDKAVQVLNQRGKS